MSGWDTPSRPTWDPQDGPEDGTQAFPAPDGSGVDDRWSQPVGSSWGGTGAVDGRREQAFPSEPNGFAPDRNGFAPDRNGFAPDRNGFASDRNGFGPDRNGFGPGQHGFPGEVNGLPPEQHGFPGEQNGFHGEQNGFARGGAHAAPSSDFFPQEFEQRQPGATLAGRQLPGRGNGDYGSAPQTSARDEPPWPGPARRESAARQESARPDYGRAGDFGRDADFGRAGDYGRNDDYGRDGEYGQTSEYGQTGEYRRQDSARADFDRPDAPGRDLPRRDSGRADASAVPSYSANPNDSAILTYSANPGYSASSTYSGQQDLAGQAPAPSQGESEQAARMDPALQDFFAPTKPDPRYAAGRPSLAPPPGGLPGNGQPGPRQPGPGPSGPGWSDQAEQPSRPADGRGPQRRPRRADDPWEDGADGPSSGSRDGRTGIGRHDDDEDDEPASARGRLLGVVGGVVVVIAAAGIAYLAVHGNNSGNNAAGGSTPTTSASATTPTAGAKPKGTGAATSPKVTGSAAAAGSYVLSTPSTAAGFPIGSDPHFLATATSTVATIEQSAIKGGGGTVTGSPVSASYTLPDAQTIEFVGYQGTFDPATVMANLKDYGSSEASYPAGPNGGELACANTTATASTPSGAVCLWVTKTTLGFTEFFTQANGPETLNSAQAKGAEDTVNLRASVETLKS